jgi:hypothetical protein
MSSFFNQNETQAWKTELYEKDDPRKLRDKYKLVMSTCKADIERGNLSGKSGDLDQQYELVKQIMMEIDDDEDPILLNCNHLLLVRHLLCMFPGSCNQ